jgi:hypothetical protein
VLYRVKMDDGEVITLESDKLRKVNVAIQTATVVTQAGNAAA